MQILVRGLRLVLAVLGAAVTSALTVVVPIAVRHPAVLAPNRTITGDALWEQIRVGFFAQVQVWFEVAVFFSVIVVVPLILILRRFSKDPRMNALVVVFVWVAINAALYFLYYGSELAWLFRLGIAPGLLGGAVMATIEYLPFRAAPPQSSTPA